MFRLCYYSSERGPLHPLPWQTNRSLDSDCAGCPNITGWGAEAACLWTRVFKPTDGIQESMQRHLQVRRPVLWYICWTVCR